MQVLLGQGLEARPDPVTNFITDEELRRFLNDIAEVVEDVANQLPDHAEFISRLPPNESKPVAAAPAFT